jgi:hypothetical protein
MTRQMPFEPLPASVLLGFLVSIFIWVPWKSRETHGFGRIVDLARRLKWNAVQSRAAVAPPPTSVRISKDSSPVVFMLY